MQQYTATLTTQMCNPQRRQQPPSPHPPHHSPPPHPTPPPHPSEDRIKLIEDIAPWTLDPEAETLRVPARVTLAMPMGLLGAAPYYSRWGCVGVGVHSDSEG